MIPRSEHPNPQLVRNDWINLNGEWEFEIDAGVSGDSRRLFEKEHLDGKIIVPFCPESPLSGVGNRDFLNCVWYRRDVTLPEDWKGSHVLLRFGAVDHTAYVYVNSALVGKHEGGYSSFCFDITSFLHDGSNSICVCAEDDTRNTLFGHGKQSHKYESHGCSYTRVTGIWQTVWLERIPETHIKSFTLTPDIFSSNLRVDALLCGGETLTAEAFYEGKSVGSVTVKAPYGGFVSCMLPLSELHLWEVGNGRLYDLTLTYGADTVNSYFGMRHIAIDGYRFLLNGKSVYQRLVLDQGYYPDGIYTAPTDEALVKDIQLSLDAGFNGARLHQKVFEPRFLYHCDRMGYIVWGEYGSWGIDCPQPESISPLLQEWNEILERDRNHPAIIGWCPLNETWIASQKELYERYLTLAYHDTVRMDPTRPCIDTSGGIHMDTDIYDLHDYTQEPDRYAEAYTNKTPEEMIAIHRQRHPAHHKHSSCAYKPGTAIFMSEYGGIKWDVNSGNSAAWGYGNAPQTEEEFIERYRGLTNILLDNPYMLGFCYTQLYDVEQEVNGLYTYSREPKFDMSIFHEINSRKAAIED